MRTRNVRTREGQESLLLWQRPVLQALLKEGLHCKSECSIILKDVACLSHVMTRTSTGTVKFYREYF